MYIVIVWTHTDEWRRIFNTESVVGISLGALLLGNSDGYGVVNGNDDNNWCHFWMKGLESHDG